MKDINPRNSQGQPHGYWEYYYSNGQLYWKGNYINNTRDGSWESYYSNGQLMFKGNHINGERDGYWERYHPNGQLRLEEFLLNI